MIFSLIGGFAGFTDRERADQRRPARARPRCWARRRSLVGIMGGNFPLGASRVAVHGAGPGGGRDLHPARHRQTGKRSLTAGGRDAESLHGPRIRGDRRCKSYMRTGWKQHLRLSSRCTIDDRGDGQPRRLGDLQQPREAQRAGAGRQGSLRRDHDQPAPRPVGARRGHHRRRRQVVRRRHQPRRDGRVRPRPGRGVGHQDPSHVRFGADLPGAGDRPHQRLLLRLGHGAGGLRRHAGGGGSREVRHAGDAPRHPVGHGGVGAAAADRLGQGLRAGADRRSHRRAGGLSHRLPRAPGAARPGSTPRSRAGSRRWSPARRTRCASRSG